MSDREKVIKGLDEITHYNGEQMLYNDIFIRGIADDAIAMLKEHEPKPAVDIADTVDGIEVGRCPSCDKGIVNKKSDPTRYCKFCGQAVKWE